MPPKFIPEALRTSVYIETGNGIYQREMMAMLTIEELLTVLGYTFTVFALDYAIGYNHQKNQK